MSNSDYSTRSGGFAFCPVGFLNGNLTPLGTLITMTGYSGGSAGIRVGMAAMIGSEIVIVTGRTGDNVSIGRGCCDTIPAAHLAGDPIWFFDDSLGWDGIEYVGTETVGVKVIPRTTSGYMPLAYAPAEQITFNLRFARPYPPGLLQANGDPWFSGPMITSAQDLVLTWAQRNRITQQDALIDHIQPTITPEAGTTYKIQIFRADNTLISSLTGLTGTTWTYPWATAVSDFSATGLIDGYLTMCSVRDGLESFQRYRLDFQIDSNPYGLGYRLGEFLGGYPP